MKTEVIQRAARRLNGQEPMPTPKPDIRQVVAEVLETLIPQVERIVRQHVESIEFEQPADRTDEVLQALSGLPEPLPQVDLSPVLQALDGLRQTPAEAPASPQSYTMRVTEFDSRNRPYAVEITADG